MKILGVAIMGGNGNLYVLNPPHRHSDLLLDMQAANVKPKEQGFVISNGEFVNRTEAMEIAKKSGQFIERSEDDPDYNSTNQLYSEDLW